MILGLAILTTTLAWYSKQERIIASNQGLETRGRHVDILHPEKLSRDPRSPDNLSMNDLNAQRATSMRSQTSLLRLPHEEPTQILNRVVEKMTGWREVKDPHVQMNLYPYYYGSSAGESSASQQQVVTYDTQGVWSQARIGQEERSIKLLTEEVTKLADELETDKGKLRSIEERLRAMSAEGRFLSADHERVYLIEKNKIEEKRDRLQRRITTLRE